MSFPGVIKGEIYLLRPPLVEEAPIYRSWFLDPEVTRWLMRETDPTVEGEAEWVRSRANSNDCRLWAIEFDGDVVGITGLDRIDWEHQFAVTGTVIGEKSAWGKGIGREVMRARRDWAFQNLGLNKLKSGYIEPNVASGRAQAACGMKIVGRMRQEYFRNGEWHDHIQTEVLRSEWEELPDRLEL